MGGRICHAYTMTLPPQQPPASPESHPVAQPSSPLPRVSQTTAAYAAQATSLAHAEVPLSAQASVNGGKREDRFATGARMEMPGQAPQSPSPFEDGVVADPAKVFSGPGYNFPPAPVNRPAQFALWVALIAVLFPFALVASIGAGIWGLIHAQVNYGVGRRQAAAALIISALSLLWWLFVWAAFMGLLPSSL